jgi:hypothetical protein
MLLKYINAFYLSRLFTMQALFFCGNADLFLPVVVAFFDASVHTRQAEVAK